MSPDTDLVFSFSDIVRPSVSNDSVTSSFSWPLALQVMPAILAFLIVPAWLPLPSSVQLSEAAELLPFSSTSA